MDDPDSTEVIDALISYAARDGLGEEVAWPDVEQLIWHLRESPVASSNLRRRMNQLNDDEAALTLADWFERAADQSRKDARDAARPAEKVLAPLQAVTLGAAATAVVLTITGSIAVSASAIVIPCFLVGAGAATFGRLRLSRREDECGHDAGVFDGLAKIARTRSEER